MNFCPGIKNSIIGKKNKKTARYDRIINELCHFYSFIDKNRVNVS